MVPPIYTINRIRPIKPLSEPNINELNNKRAKNNIPNEKGVTITKNKPNKDNKSPK